MKYRKKPVVIEVYKWLSDSAEAKTAPVWFSDALEDGIAFFGPAEDDPEGPAVELYLKTLEGVHHVSLGDFIIQGVKGELYPCKPDIFEATYELVDGE